MKFEEKAIEKYFKIEGFDSLIDVITPAVIDLLEIIIPAVIEVTPLDVNLYNPLFTSGLIADYFKLLHGDKFVCADERVYMFNGIFWESLDK